MQFSRVNLESDITYGKLDVHSKINTIELLPSQFTLEFWIKCKFHPENKKKKEIFGLYMYEEEPTKSKYVSDIEDGSEIEMTDTSNLGVYVSIFVDANSSDYTFTIHNRTIVIPKHKLDNKWNHIALTYDKLNNTSCIWYLNGRQILAANMNSTTMNAFKDKYFCRFLWTCYKEEDYIWLYNVNITTNPTESGWYGIRYSQPFYPESLIAYNSRYTGLRDHQYGLSYENDETTDPIIRPKMAHNICGVENLIYLPFQNYVDEDFGTIKPDWKVSDEMPQKSIDVAMISVNNNNCNMYYSRYDILYDLDKYLRMNSYHNYISNNQSMNFSKYENGFTFDWFVYKFPAANGQVGLSLSPFYFDKFNIKYNIPEGSSWAHTIDVPFEKSVIQLMSGSYSYPYYKYYDTNNTHYSNKWIINDENALNKNSAYVWYKTQSTYNYQNVDNTKYLYDVVHVAKVFKPGDSIRTFINGIMIQEMCMPRSRNNETEWISYDANAKSYNYYNFNYICKNLDISNAKEVILKFYQDKYSYMGISHFRMTPECLWWDEHFDPTTEKRLFIMPTDTNRNDDEQKISDITESDIALEYPVKGFKTIYDRRYSKTANVGKGYSEEKSNFHPEPNSAHPNKIILDTNVINKGEHKPTKYYGYPALTTNTYKDRRNIVMFRNHHIENKSWTVEFWVYIEQKVETSDYFELAYVSGFENMGFLGLWVSGIGRIMIRYNENYHHSINTLTAQNYGWNDENTGYKFNVNDWNHVAITSELRLGSDSVNEMDKVYVHVNGELIWSRGPYWALGYLHRIFFYTGSSDAPIRPYFTGIRATVGKAKYNQPSIKNWENCPN